MYTHICVGAKSLEESKTFYDAVLGALDVPESKQFSDRAMAYEANGGTFLVLLPFDGEQATHANGGTVGFAAKNAAAVDAAHAAGLANGGSDEGAPGKRPSAPGNAYGAYLRDPVGNKISLFCQLPEGK